VYRRKAVQLGASLAVADIGTGPLEIRDYAQAVEGLGFDYLLAGDHVLGHNPAGFIEHGSRIGVSIEHARRVGTTSTAFHDPFVLFGFLSGCTAKVGFASGVLILAQRQAALVAKQATSNSRAWAWISTRAAGAPKSKSGSCNPFGRSRTRHFTANPPSR
jgi:alkanesulfonate monooxygenase SsuD/methylene tetrahydromethanopterin reductase-like flavin-dependent oxidoreductase (luciferase family)